MEFPTTMLDFMHQFADDDACRAYLEKMLLCDGGRYETGVPGPVTS